MEVTRMVMTHANAAVSCRSGEWLVKTLSQLTPRQCVAELMPAIADKDNFTKVLWSTKPTWVKLISWCQSSSPLDLLKIVNSLKALTGDPNASIEPAPADLNCALEFQYQPDR